MNYLEILENSFKIKNENNVDDSLTRFEFLSDCIFDFVIYDSEMSELFGKKAVEVCNAITDRKTFDYIRNEENYKWFILMCNMPFFFDKLNWGTSIRGAFWKCGAFQINSLYLWENYHQIETLEFNREQWIDFMKAIQRFAIKEIC